MFVTSIHVIGSASSLFFVSVDRYSCLWAFGLFLVFFFFNLFWSRFYHAQYTCRNPRAQRCCMLMETSILSPICLYSPLKDLGGCLVLHSLLPSSNTTILLLIPAIIPWIRSMARVLLQLCIMCKVFCNSHQDPGRYYMVLHGEMKTWVS